MFKIIDISSWERKNTFSFFQKYDDPTWDMVAEVKVHHLYEAAQKENTSFFLSFLFVATKVFNEIPAFRQRIDANGQVIEFNVVHPGSTILYDNNTFGFGYFQFNPEFRIFIRDASEAFETQKLKKDMDPRDEDLARLYFSPIPWISFTGFRHPFLRSANHSIPKIVFGRHFQRGSEKIMAVGVTAHHGLVDGYHTGLFFSQLQLELDDPWNCLQITRAV